jgi:hypothetical protein
MKPSIVPSSGTCSKIEKASHIANGTIFKMKVLPEKSKGLLLVVFSLERIFSLGFYKKLKLLSVRRSFKDIKRTYCAYSFINFVLFETRRCVPSVTSTTYIPLFIEGARGTLITLRPGLVVTFIFMCSRPTISYTLMPRL